MYTADNCTSASSYTDHVTMAISGHVCINWSSQVALAQRDRNVYQLSTGERRFTAKNYRRNADGNADYVWCYTATFDIVDEACDVNFCGMLATWLVKVYECKWIIIWISLTFVWKERVSKNDCLHSLTCLLARQPQVSMSTCCNCVCACGSTSGRSMWIEPLQGCFDLPPVQQHSLQVRVHRKWLPNRLVLWSEY